MQNEGDLMVKKKKRKLLIFITALIGACMLYVAVINLIVVATGNAGLVYAVKSENSPLDAEEVKEIKDFSADCILVLGCGIKDKSTPSAMLKDRLEAGVMLYKAGAAPKLLLSGDNGTEYHNELHVMLKYCLDNGVPPEDIFCDHAGFSTSESMIRAKEIFGVEKAIIVTQKYHEYRALYIAKQVGFEAIGVSSDQKAYGGQVMRDIREILARNKDFHMYLIGKQSATGGEKIPLSGDGKVSHGE